MERVHAHRGHSGLKGGRHHTHGGGMLSMDCYAQRSRLCTVSPFLKTVFAVLVLLVCVAADSAAVGLLVSAGMLWACIAFSGAPVRYVFSLMSIPVLFIVASCLAIVFEVVRTPLGFFDLPLFGIYLSATPAGLRSAEGFIRGQLARSLNLRNTPEIRFIQDDSIAYGVEMSHKIEELAESWETADGPKTGGTDETD